MECLNIEHPGIDFDNIMAFSLHLHLFSKGSYYSPILSLFFVLVTNI